MDNNIENDVIRALDTTSIELKNKFMEDINPSDYKMPDKAALKRVKKNVMNQINKVNTKNTGFRWGKTIGIALGTAAAIAVIATVTISPVRTKAIELFKNIFSFIPGEGIVAADEDAPITDTYILAENVKASNDDLSVQLFNATAHDNIIDLDYTVFLSKISDEARDQVFIEAQKRTKSTDYIIDSDYLSAYSDLYTGLGYDRYFEINNEIDEQYCALKKPYSTLTVSGREISPETSKITFGEASGERTCNIHQTYLISDAGLQNDGNLLLKLAELEIPFKLAIAETYSSQDELLSNVSTLTNGDIKVMADYTWDDDNSLTVDIYPVDLGSYSEITFIDCTLEVNGENCLSYPSDKYSDMSKPCTSFGFNLSDVEPDSELIFKINCISLMDSNGELNIEIPEQVYGKYDINSTFEHNGTKLTANEMSIVNYCDKENETMVSYGYDTLDYTGDPIIVSFNAEKTTGAPQFETFGRVLYNGTTEAELWSGPTENGIIGCILTNNSIENITSITFSNPIFTINDVFESVVEWPKQ